MGLPRCPTCGSLLRIRDDEDPYIDRYGRDDEYRGWFSGGWLGLVSFLSYVAFRLMPWIKRHRWCPRCGKTV
jgi:hypothetical protein